MNTELVITNLVKRFGEVTAVSGISLDVPRGVFLTLLGPSGCGKTTTIRMIAGLDRPDEGTISLGGSLVSSKDVLVPPEKRNIGMVFQSYAVWPHMTVADNVAFPLRMKKTPRREIAQRVADMLSLVGLRGLENRLPTQLSGGQQQRVALARALVANPSVFLLDEPLSNLDAKLREGMRLEISSLQKRLGITTIYVTHSQEEALTMSDLIAVMNNGRIVQLGRPLDIYKDPETPFVAGFIGLASFVSGQLIDKEHDYLVIRLENDDIIRSSKGHALDTVGGTAVQVMVRPEDIHLEVSDKDPEAISSDSMNNRISGTIRQIAFSGNIVHYFVEVVGLSELVRVQNVPTDKFGLHDQVQLVFSPRAAHTYSR